MCPSRRSHRRCYLDTVISSLSSRHHSDGWPERSRSSLPGFTVPEPDR
ncbi:hypothetical protein HMPREF1861_01452 [Corynebacterium kroppenstedtii]|nr:hypothetical protein HMPREF1861_01452 [Corynebacterium kroppenstedtii]